MTPYEEFRRAIRDLIVLAESDIRELWRLVQESGPDALYELLPDVVDTYGSAAQSLAADYYDNLRETEGVPGRFAPIVEPPVTTGTSALIGWATAEATSPETFQELVLGGVQRRIVNQSRDVVTRTAIADPRARGWMRIGSGKCDFCTMLISRGAVYTERTADFAAHDHCGCNAAPAFNPEQIRSVKSEFVASARRRSEETQAADNERVREWVAANL
ncbi:VG15 protein [Nocardia gipuzkoensis]